MSFPLSPANGQTTQVNGINYYWDAAKGVWRRIQSLYITEYGQIWAAANVGVVAFEQANLAAPAFTQANAANNLASAAYGVANNLISSDATKSLQITLLQNVNTYQNTTSQAINTYAGSGYAQANAANNLATSSFDVA